MIMIEVPATIAIINHIVSSARWVKVKNLSVAVVVETALVRAGSVDVVFCCVEMSLLVAIGDVSVKTLSCRELMSAFPVGCEVREVTDVVAPGTVAIVVVVSVSGGVLETEVVRAVVSTVAVVATAVGTIVLAATDFARRRCLVVGDVLGSMDWVILVRTTCLSSLLVCRRCCPVASTGDVSTNTPASAVELARLSMAVCSTVAWHSGQAAQNFSNVHFDTQVCLFEEHHGKQLYAALETATCKIER